jgi:hypothetical protein
MALSALSMAHNVQRPDALEHYQQVIPALKNSVQSSEDSYSDGAFLSHYILLLYEVRHNSAQGVSHYEKTANWITF